MADACISTVSARVAAGACWRAATQHCTAYDATITVSDTEIAFINAAAWLQADLEFTVADWVHMDERPGTTGDEPVKSAFRALEILELLTAEPKALSFSECQQKLGYPKASLHGLLRTMASARWLSFDEVAKGYVLGVRAWEAGVAYAGMLPLESRARPFMTNLRDQTTETVQLAVLDDFDVLYIAKVDGEHMLRLDSVVGRRLEPHASGVGKVLLAGLGNDLLRVRLAEQHLERFTDATVVEPEVLLVELQAVRENGFATDREERTLGVSCVAVGVYDHASSLVAAMSVSAPAVRFGEAERSAALVHLRLAARDLSAALGRALPRSTTRGPAERTESRQQNP